MMDIGIWTDGGCFGNPGPGAWAFIIADMQKNVIYRTQGHDLKTTNNRMELMAVIKALHYTLEQNWTFDNIYIHTDSRYVEQGMTGWVDQWKTNGWLNAKKKPVKNKELWVELDGLASRLPIEWVWIPGHSGNTFNEYCDEETRKEIKRLMACLPGKYPAKSFADDSDD
jgi:ribonuclease HI